MANYENDANPNDEWEEGWETSFNEFNWEQYLQTEAQEVQKYQAIYSKLIRSANRLDEVALYMGWQHGAESHDCHPADNDASSSSHPYTLHRHPLFVSSKALHGWLTEQWQRRVTLAPESVSACSALAYLMAINESDHYGVLAVTALDIDDFALAIAYFKRGMVALNRALGLLADFESQNIEAISLYAKHARIRLFDIREIWLRVSSDCRATISRGPEEE